MESLPASLAAGLSEHRKLVVRPSMLTGFVGQPGGHDVYSTPTMINVRSTADAALPISSLLPRCRAFVPPADRRTALQPGRCYSSLLVPLPVPAKSPLRC